MLPGQSTIGVGDHADGARGGIAVIMAGPAPTSKTSPSSDPQQDLVHVMAMLSESARSNQLRGRAG